jgi:hypothetical protein
MLVEYIVVIVSRFILLVLTCLGFAKVLEIAERLWGKKISLIITCVLALLTIIGFVVEFHIRNET